MTENEENKLRTLIDIFRTQEENTDYDESYASGVIHGFNEASDDLEILLDLMVDNNIPTMGYINLI